MGINVSRSSAWTKAQSPGIDRCAMTAEELKVSRRTRKISRPRAVSAEAEDGEGSGRMISGVCS